MSCEGSAEITFEFWDGDGSAFLEIRPRSMQFDRQRGKFDYAQAKFPESVAEHLQPHIDDESSVLRQPLPVHVKIEGELIYRLLWVPESFHFTDNEAHIEFHDPQKFLTRGTVDWRSNNIELKDAYQRVFAERDTTGPKIFNDIKFTVEEETYENIRTLNQAEFDLVREDDNAFFTAVPEDNRDSSGEEQNITQILNGHYVVDFDKISPWEAITKLNDLYGVDTWAGTDGNFWVGSRKATGVSHIATPDDKRVWKLTEYNVTPPRDPVVQSVVRGSWQDDPSESPITNNVPEIERLNIGTNKFRVEGVAKRPDVTFGHQIVQEVDARRDALEAIAKRNMINKQREQWSGYIEIDPEFSGKEVSDPKFVTIGDSILTVPPESDSEGDSDDPSFCKSNIREAMFDVVGVQHSLTGSGNWYIRLDLVPSSIGDFAPENIETELRYYDPSKKEMIEENTFDDMSYWDFSLTDGTQFDEDDWQWVWGDSLSESVFDFAEDNLVD